MKTYVPSPMSEDAKRFLEALREQELRETPKMKAIRRQVASLDFAPHIDPALLESLTKSIPSNMPSLSFLDARYL